MQAQRAAPRVMNASPITTAFTLAHSRWTRRPTVYLNSARRRLQIEGGETRPIRLLLGIFSSHRAASARPPRRARPRRDSTPGPRPPRATVQGDVGTQNASATL